jgi:hypothetical protein
LVEEFDGLSPPGQDRQGIVEAAEVQFGDDGVEALLDQEAAGTRGELVAHE